MGKNKLLKFQINATRRNVIEPGKEIYNCIKGNWNSFFQTNYPITVELCCGYGEYTTGLAEKYPNRNFVGVDIKGARIWKGSTIATEKQLNNAAFLRIRMYELENFFAENEVEQIWLVFPDPRMRDRDEKHRLTNTYYLGKYFNILKSGGLFMLKTDNEAFFEYSLNAISKSGYPVENICITENLYQSEWLPDHHGIETKYEKMFRQMGSKICYAKFKLNK
ncbi:MAG: tRNA (guanosine(46)-N7)-methyltransferase TrmB [Cytophagaceae bacterium]|nr:tRNA (guanosine(46)-N7)-methyltransferase TrmB [Cytophagaceae bacterium]MDW8457220.1 tRNA (guanosine(46)-N7)-methyltransferase TrmB [Cytophagaceae bacterium]